MQDILSFIKERGYFFQCTEEKSFSNFLENNKTVFYLGFDCTAQSLHLGHLVPIMLARTLIKFGHKVIVLFGGGTTKIGDPSGKDKMRQMLTQAQIDQNVESIKSILKKFLGDCTFVNNAQWLDEIKYLEFLRDIGKHFSVNRMLDFESVKSRIARESHLSFLEFNYMILQAYDFVKLNELYGCRVQIGGSDQWGNIVCGVELARKLKKDQLFGLTVPLVKTASGKKMGKTESGAIWLDDAMLCAYNYWQYFRNTDDADVKKFLNIFTELEDSQIQEIIKSNDINQAKKILATQATQICHGSVAAKNAQNAAVKEFECSDSSDLPAVHIKQNENNIVDVLKLTGLANSNSEAKRIIRSGAVKVDDKKALDLQYCLHGGQKISVGKKRFVIAEDVHKQ